MARLPIAEMAAQGGPAAMVEAAAFGRARAPVAILAALVFTAMFATLVKMAVTPSKITTGGATAENALTETRRHAAVSATTMAAATAARTSIDLSEGEPKHNRSTGRESSSKNHPSSSC
jgi:hypothetical protein